MIKLDFEYGQGTMSAVLPGDRTEVFIPGETVPDPPVLEDIEGATREAILNPMGMEPIARLVGPGSKVVSIFPDKVKGGFRRHPPKTAIPSW